MCGTGYLKEIIPVKSQNRQGESSHGEEHLIQPFNSLQNLMRWRRGKRTSIGGDHFRNLFYFMFLKPLFVKAFITRYLLAKCSTYVVLFNLTATLRGRREVL